MKETIRVNATFVELSDSGDHRDVHPYRASLINAPPSHVGCTRTGALVSLANRLESMSKDIRHYVKEQEK